ncbi:MAG: DUF1015 domain-containing protein [Bacteroidetes bacterium]|nr:DUF1015 domain-containing protein [Bacteroidota bacterium]
MATVVPFKAILPKKELAGVVASRSVDFYSHEELEKSLTTNPNSFLHVIHPDFSDKQHTKPGSIERLTKIKKKLNELIDNGTFTALTEDAFFIYRQSSEFNSYTGIIGCASVEDYWKGEIKIHEHTLTERENKLKEYLEVCNFNAEPVLFGYPSNHKINTIIETVLLHNPDISYTTEKNSKHELWKVVGTEAQQIQAEFCTIKNIYIADGHHRSASSALLGKSKKETNKAHTGKEAYNYYLGAFFPETQLKIVEFNRVVKDLNGLSAAEFIAKVENYFTVVKKSEELLHPKALHEIVLYLEKKWYLLKPRAVLINEQHPVESLDVHILSEFILSPILGIKDLKTDKRISFSPGIKSNLELLKLCEDGKAKAIFFLYPIQFEQVKRVADNNLVMPPKSTWVEPKMPSGLTIYSLQGDL